MVVTIILCLNLTGPQGTQIIGSTLFWVCLRRCFWMRSAFESVGWVKQVALLNAGRDHRSICWQKGTGRENLLSWGDKTSEEYLKLRQRGFSLSKDSEPQIQNGNRRGSKQKQTAGIRMRRFLTITSMYHWLEGFPGVWPGTFAPV